MNEEVAILSAEDVKKLKHREYCVRYRAKLKKRCRDSDSEAVKVGLSCFCDPFNTNYVFCCSFLFILDRSEKRGKD